MITKKIRHDIVFYLARLLFFVVNLLPRSFTLMIGESLGMAAYLFIKKERHKALTNLNRAYGDSLSYRRKKEIARDSFVTLGRCALEAMRLPKYYHHQIYPDIEIVGEQNLINALERKNGVVVFTGHIGNFELLAAFVAQSGYKTAVIGRELYQKRLDQLLIQNRSAMGLVNVRTDDSPRTILKLLKDNYTIGFLIDTDSFRVAGELTPFFGRPAKTPIGPTQLGLLTKSAFLPVFCLSFPGGKYKIIIGEELMPDSHDRSPENVFKITCQMTETIEDMIRQYPEQWIWLHNRWHTHEV